MRNLEETIRAHRQEWPVAPTTNPWKTYMQYRQSVRTLLLDVASRLDPRYASAEEIPVTERICYVIRRGTKRSLSIYGVVGSYSFLVGTRTTTLTDIGWPSPRTSREDLAHLLVYETDTGRADTGFVAEYRIDSHQDGAAARDVADIIERRMHDHPDLERVPLGYLHGLQR